MHGTDRCNICIPDVILCTPRGTMKPIRLCTASTTNIHVVLREGLAVELEVSYVRRLGPASVHQFEPETLRSYTLSGAEAYFGRDAFSTLRTRVLLHSHTALRACRARALTQNGSNSLQFVQRVHVETTQVTTLGHGHAMPIA